MECTILGLNVHVERVFHTVMEHGQNVNPIEVTELLTTPEYKSDIEMHDDMYITC